VAHAYEVGETVAHACPEAQGLRLFVVRQLLVGAPGPDRRSYLCRVFANGAMLSGLIEFDECELADLPEAPAPDF
jgi:hypothetical protein